MKTKANHLQRICLSRMASDGEENTQMKDSVDEFDEFEQRISHTRTSAAAAELRKPKKTNFNFGYLSLMDKSTGGCLVASDEPSKFFSHTHCLFAISRLF